MAVLVVCWQQGSICIGKSSLTRLHRWCGISVIIGVVRVDRTAVGDALDWYELSVARSGPVFSSEIGVSCSKVGNALGWMESFVAQSGQVLSLTGSGS